MIITNEQSYVFGGFHYGLENPEILDWAYGNLICPGDEEAMRQAEELFRGITTASRHHRHTCVAAGSLYSGDRIVARFGEKKEGIIDLSERKRFYDPHPGFGGASIPLPGGVWAVIQTLNGRTELLGQAIAAIRILTKGKVLAEPGWIGLELTMGAQIHFWRLIRYR